MKMKKSINLIATTTASSLIVTMTVGCGADEKQKTEKEQLTQKDITTNNENSKSIDIKIKDTKGSLDTTRCIGSGRCVIQDN